MCVSLYQFDLTDDLADKDYAVLSVEERDFAQTLRHAPVKRRYLRVRFHLRHVLAAFLHTPPNHLRFTKNDYGKPYLADYPHIQFNISHSGEHLLIAISAIGAIGVDIEQPRILHTPLVDLVEKCFSNPEINYWQHLPAAEQLLAFYRFWTRKEAFVKAVGRGVALGLPKCVIADASPPYLVSIPSECGTVDDWRLFDLPLTAGLYGALVIATQHLPADFVPPLITLQTSEKNHD